MWLYDIHISMQVQVPMQVYREARGRYWSLLYHPLPYHLETGLTKLEAPISLTLLAANSLPGFLLSASLHPELQAPFMPWFLVLWKCWGF